MRIGTLFVASLIVSAANARADEIKVMTSGAFATAYRELAPQFERVTGHTIVTLTTASGSGASSILSRVQHDEPVDVVIAAAAQLDDLATSGKVVAGSRVDLARSSIGMVVRAGALKPDISSVDALKRTLLAAKSIAYSAAVSGIYVSTELFPRLGIAERVKAKSRRIEGEPVAAVVARGDAEIGFQQISELLPVPGIEYAGPLPAEVQRVTVFTAGVVASSTHAEAARALIQFLASSDAAATITKSGLELPATK